MFYVRADINPFHLLSSEVSSFSSVFLASVDHRTVISDTLRRFVEISSPGIKFAIPLW